MEMPSYINAYLVNLVSGEVIPLITSPQGLSESISANYNEQTIVARSAPMITYTDTGARGVNFNLKVHEDILPKGYNIDSYVNAFKALVYPEYNNGNVTPPSVKLMVGTSVNVIGVPKSVNISWDTIIFRDNRIPMASIDVSITETRKTCPGATTIRNGG